MLFFLDVNLLPIAYLDPGTGTFIIQLLCGAVAGASFAMSAYWSKIKAFFSKSSDVTSSVTSNETSSATDSSDTVTDTAQDQGDETS